MILPAKAETVPRAGSRPPLHWPAGGLGGSKEEARSCGTFLELSELNEVSHSLSALCSQTASSPNRRLGDRRQEPGARHRSPSARPGVSPAAGDAQRVERARERRPPARTPQPARLWKPRVARRARGRTNEPEGAPRLHEVPAKTEVEVEYSP